mgnify:FL=1
MRLNIPSQYRSWLGGCTMLDCCELLYWTSSSSWELLTISYVMGLSRTSSLLANASPLFSMSLGSILWHVCLESPCFRHPKCGNQTHPCHSLWRCISSICDQTYSCLDRYYEHMQHNWKILDLVVLSLYHFIPTLIFCALMKHMGLGWPSKMICWLLLPNTCFVELIVFECFELFWSKFNSSLNYTIVLRHTPHNSLHSYHVLIAKLLEYGVLIFTTIVNSKPFNLQSHTFQEWSTMKVMK